MRLGLRHAGMHRGTAAQLSSAYLYSHRAALVRRMLCTLAYPLLVRYALSPGRHGHMEGV